MTCLLEQLQASRLDFELRSELEAHAPAEARGLARDEVRLLVSSIQTNTLTHTIFNQLDHHLNPGDVLVLNTSGTLPASLPATRADGTLIRVHLSTRLPANLWLVELRTPSEVATRPFRHGHAGEQLYVPGDGTLTLLSAYQPFDQPQDDLHSPTRLWVATLRLPCPLLEYLQQYGEPIRYAYVPQPWPLSAYQTVYATEPGSAEMPSAGRAFTPQLLTRLAARGVHIAPLLLHTGVASLEAHEPPYEEWYRVPASTAHLINHARKQGGRSIAVGTTTIRALETVSEPDGTVHPGAGWTRLVITPERGIWAVDGLITGFHEPCATHLALLQALAGQAHLLHTYAAAIQQRYLWHEFGDVHLLLP